MLCKKIHEEIWVQLNLFVDVCGVAAIAHQVDAFVRAVIAVVGAVHGIDLATPGYVREALFLYLCPPFNELIISLSSSFADSFEKSTSLNPQLGERAPYTSGTR